MLGWHVTVLRPEKRLAGPDDPRLAVPTLPDRDDAIIDNLGAVQSLSRWEADSLDFLAPLLDARNAVQVAQTGYPSIFVAGAHALRRAGDLDLKIYFEPQSVIPLAEAVAGCDDGEWLVVEAWDLS